jgi:hypothetical protein
MAFPACRVLHFRAFPCLGEFVDSCGAIISSCYLRCWQVIWRIQAWSTELRENRCTASRCTATSTSALSTDAYFHYQQLLFRCTSLPAFLSSASFHCPGVQFADLNVNCQHVYLGCSTRLSAVHRGPPWRLMTGEWNHSKDA